jgi:hypothetical protein
MKCIGVWWIFGILGAAFMDMLRDVADEYIPHDVSN